MTIVATVGLADISGHVFDIHHCYRWCGPGNSSRGGCWYHVSHTLEGEVTSAFNRLDGLLTLWSTGLGSQSEGDMNKGENEDDGCR